MAFLARLSQARQRAFLRGLPKVDHVHFDDLLTVEHTKCKPLAISLAVEAPGRGCIAGQGELKKLRFGPLFALNHTCAMLRASIATPK